MPSICFSFELEVEAHDIKQTWCAMFGRKKTVVATYSKNRPVQITRNDHFLTPDTPEDLWAPSSKEKRSKQDANKKGKSTLRVNTIIGAWHRNDKGWGEGMG